MLMVRSCAKLLASRRRNEIDRGKKILVIIPQTVHAFAHGPNPHRLSSLQWEAPLRAIDLLTLLLPLGASHFEDKFGA
jgi:hypothetical protein